jgi:hypothetical protein
MFPITSRLQNLPSKVHYMTMHQDHLLKRRGINNDPLYKAREHRRRMWRADSHATGNFRLTLERASTTSTAFHHFA